MNKVPQPSTNILEMLRVRIGLDSADSSRDAELEAVYAVTVNWMEQYLNRYLVAGDYTETIVHKAGRNVSLKGYPIVSINNVSSPDRDQLDITEYHVDKENGVLMLDGYASYHELIVTYSMSDPMIGGLAIALLVVFDMVWANANSAGGVDVGTGSIKAITSDGARVEYDTGSSGAYASGIDEVSGMPASLVGVLNLYRREWC